MRYSGLPLYRDFPESGNQIATVVNRRLQLGTKLWQITRLAITICQKVADSKITRVSTFCKSMLIICLDPNSNNYIYHIGKKSVKCQYQNHSFIFVSHLNRTQVCRRVTYKCATLPWLGYGQIVAVVTRELTCALPRPQVTRVRTIDFMTRLLLDLDIRDLIITSRRNLKLGPWFAEVC